MLVFPPFVCNLKPYDIFKNTNISTFNIIQACLKGFKIALNSVIYGGLYSSYNMTIIA